jgi:hypothetical protein
MALITFGRVAPPEPANAMRGATLCIGGVAFMRRPGTGSFSPGRTKLEVSRRAARPT